MDRELDLVQISIIATVVNEGASLRRLLDSLVEQTYRPDEVVIVDGGSTDDTLVILQSYQAQLPLQVISARGCNISQGRNLAVRASKGHIIACTDAGVRLHPQWLEKLLEGFGPATGAYLGRSAREYPRDQLPPLPPLVAGWFEAAPESPFERVLGATTLPNLEDVNPFGFLPSSRSVAFTRAAWEQAGGYPEWLDYCEDLVFDWRLMAQGRTGWAPRAVVYFRPRSSLRSFFLQYYRYARGDGKADLWRLRHVIRYGTYLVVLPALLGHALWGRWAKSLGWIGLLIGVLLYCRRPWQRLWPHLPTMTWRQRLQALALVPVLRAVGDVAKMLGYPVGLWWRRRHRDQIDWPSR